MICCIWYSWAKDYKTKDKSESIFILNSNLNEILIFLSDILRGILKSFQYMQTLDLTKWNCNKLGAPRQCNIVINWGDPSSPIRYNVIYGQPLTCITVYFSLVTAKWHFVRITSAIRCLGSISRMSEDAEFWRLHNKYVHWNTCLLSSQFFYPSENVATK